MRVVILGSGTGIPDLRTPRGYAGIYVRAGGEHLLLDAGPGTLKQLARLGVTYLDLDRIFLTHFHPDHCLDLVSILFAMRLPAPRPQDIRAARQAGIPPPRARTKPLVVYGPKGLSRLYRRLNTAFDGWIAPKTYGLTLKEVGETTLRLSGYTVRTKRMRHAGGRALGYRLEHRGKSLAYSGDTDVCPAIIKLGRDADLLILECSVTDERKVLGHLTPTECGQIASQARCRHLLLTHFYPVFLRYNILRRVRRGYQGRLTLARDLRAFQL